MDTAFGRAGVPLAEEDLECVQRPRDRARARRERRLRAVT